MPKKGIFILMNLKISNRIFLNRVSDYLDDWIVDTFSQKVENQSPRWMPGPSAWKWLRVTNINYPARWADLDWGPRDAYTSRTNLAQPGRLKMFRQWGQSYNFTEAFISWKGPISENWREDMRAKLHDVGCKRPMMLKKADPGFRNANLGRNRE